MFIPQSQVRITPAARKHIEEKIPSFGLGIIAGLNWALRSYEEGPRGEILNEKFEHFFWGAFGEGDINEDCIWQIGRLKMYVQDGRWSSDDTLKMRVKDGVIILELD